MPFGGEDDYNINAGASPIPLVSPADTSVVGPQAVQQLVSSYRNGFITNEDILDRVGQIGLARKQALIEQLGEYVNPDVIQSRLAQAQAAGAQANLQTSTAQAQQGLVSPIANAQRIQSLRTAADATYGGGVSAFQQYGPWFGHTQLPRKDNGDPDFDAMGQVGLQLSQPMMLRELAGQGLEKSYDGDQVEGGKVVKHIYNKWGVDISPGSEGQQYYQRLMMFIPGITPVGAAPALNSLMPRQNSSASGLVNPNSPAQNAEQATSPEPAQASATVPASEAPSASQTPGQPPDYTIPYTPPASSAALVQGPATGSLNTEDTIRKTITEDPTYKSWREAVPYAGTFDQLVNQVEANKKTLGTGKLPAGYTDIGLVEAVVKLYDPTNRINAFKFQSLKDMQARQSEWDPTNIFNVKLMNNAMLTPQSRDQLIALGNAAITGRELAMRPVLQGAVEMAKRSPLGADPNNVLASLDERRIYYGGPHVRYQQSPSETAAQPSSQGSANPSPANNKVFSGPDGRKFIFTSPTTIQFQ